MILRDRPLLLLAFFSEKNIFPHRKKDAPNVLHRILRTVSKKTLTRKILSFKRSGAISAVSLRFSAEYVHVVVLWVKCFGRVHIFFLT